MNSAQNSSMHDLSLRDLHTLSAQETLLLFPSFDPFTAWQIGCLLRDRLLQRNAGGTIEIQLNGQILFACTTPGAKPSQADWIRRKRNTVHHFRRSTYAVGRELVRDNTRLDILQFPETDFAAHGGGFPIRLTADPDTVIGTIILSGLPQRDDHNLVVSVLAEHLHLTIPELEPPVIS
jgi:uncharacterized protein (UPF0303 family)